MDEETFRVVGGLTVANTPNGKMITRAELLTYDPLVNIDALVLGGHLSPVLAGEPVQDVAEVEPVTKKAGG